MDNEMPVILRVDGGNVFSVAMGHVYRCLKLADYLREHCGISPLFIMKDYHGGVQKVREWDFDIITIPGDSDTHIDIEITKTHVQNALLIIDVRHYAPKHVDILRKNAKRTVLFDDLSGTDYRPDVLINPAVLPRHHEYPGGNSDVSYCLGPDYFILGRQKTRPRDNVSETVKSILVSLGGADPANYSMELLKKIAAISAEFQFNFVLGPGYGHKKEFRLMADELRADILIFEDVNDLTEMMAASDLAITAGGDTCLELAWTGTPGMIAPTISYEAETAEYLNKKEIFVSLGDIRNSTSEEVCSAIISFVDNYEKRHLFSANGRQLIDGMGIKRVVSTMEVSCQE